MTRLKWLWWKFWAWLTTPWHPVDKLGNPRGKKRRENPFYRPALYFMYALNVLTFHCILILLLLMAVYS